jgi:phosphoserine phosphatase RsbU/P
MAEKISKIKRLTIGFQISNIEDRYPSLLWPGVFDVAKERDVNLIIFSGGTPNYPEKYAFQKNIVYNFINTHNLDGLIMATGTLCNFISIAEFNKYYKRFNPLPMVSLGIEIEGIPSILVDNQSGMKKAVVHLIEHHHCKEFVFIRGPVTNQ